MKKLFNRTKRPEQEWDGYDESIYDLDDIGEGTEEDGYYAESGEVDYDADLEPEDGEYYREDAAEDAYDAGEETGENEAYEDGEAVGYWTEEYDQEYEADESDAEQEGDGYAAEETDYGDYYADEMDEAAEEYDTQDGYDVQDEYDDGAYVAADGYGSGDRADVIPMSGSRRRPSGHKAGFMGKLQKGLAGMGTMDRVILGTGVAVLILALITGAVFVNYRIRGGQVSNFVNVGTQLDGIDVIGEAGLLAVADAQIARMAAASAVQDGAEENSGYNETEYSREVTVGLEMVSIQKDLKIKFVNQNTNKLIANVPFAVRVTDPDGKTTIWSDDDMDGIIYKKDITPGNYTVVMEPLTDERYASYVITTASKTVEVLKNIKYEKVDVENEVKSESEVDASKEDTAQNETQVESSLQDTVPWVESKVIPGGYAEVSKSSIPDPMVAEGGTAVARTFTDWGVALAAETGGSISDNDSSPSPEIPTESPTSSPTPDPLTIKLEPNQVTTTVNGVVYSQVTLVTPSDLSGKTVIYTFADGNTSFSNDYVSATVDSTGMITVTGKTVISSTPIVVVAQYTDGSEISNQALLNVAVNPAKTITISNTAPITFVGESLVLNATVSDTITPNLQVVSSDAAIASVSVKQTDVGTAAITVQGLKAGTATVTVNLVEGSSTSNVIAATTTFTVTVKENPKNDRVTKLTNASGTQLYVEENGTYREAVYADFYAAAKFYIPTEPTYTGWQTINGKVYYYKADGKYVTGEQVIQGAKYNFASDGTLVTGNGALGIDVSKWNGTIDWKAVKNSGVNYVIIRCGYRGSAAGSLIEDPKFKENIQGATAAGLKVGVYFFTQAIDEREAVEEASMVLSLIKNYKISYPVFLDVESSGGRADSIDKATRTAVCKAFCQTIQNSGYTAGIYANKNWLETKLDPSALSAYKIWLAQYAATPTYTGRYDLWQYRSTGRINGISGDVDMNLSYLGY